MYIYVQVMNAHISLARTRASLTLALQPSVRVCASLHMFGLVTR